MSDKCDVKGICKKNNVWQKEVALMGIRKNHWSRLVTSYCSNPTCKKLKPVHIYCSFRQSLLQANRVCLDLSTMYDAAPFPSINTHFQCPCCRRNHRHTINSHWIVTHSHNLSTCFCVPWYTQPACHHPPMDPEGKKLETLACGTYCL